MLPHPFTESTINKSIGVSLIGIAIAVQWGILTFYGNAQPVPALVDSFFSVTLLTTAGFAGWYAISFIRVWQVQILIAFIVQFVCLGVSFALLVIVGIGDPENFLYTLPLRFVLGLLCWIILLQWYSNMQQKEDSKEEQTQPEVKISTTSPSSETSVPHETIDRISVKDGSRIHIVHIEELYCLQASGDYVTLFTPSGQYIKEQTMKYFEYNLPQTFVRIHRSSIVNTEFIVRVELFGKENYMVKLKDGTSLRASNAGYKLLKERLSL